MLDKEFIIKERLSVAEQMSRSGLFTEEQVNDTKYDVDTWPCVDGQIHTGFTPNTVAKFLDTSGNTVRDWCHKGKVKYFSTGYMMLIPVEELIRLKQQWQKI